MAAATARLAKPLTWTEFSDPGMDSARKVEARPDLWGDVVLARRDIPASYHLCVTHDDAVQGVTLVTRGLDLKPATALHRLLQALLGWPEPSYAHHRLLTDASGRRLAKRDNAPALRALREAGHSPAAVRAMVGFPDPA
jgi:glutamyl-Q tRNA(Asp) synthetase